jgi:DNA polymerase beta
MPSASRGAALVGLTGDTEFNRHLRGKAIKLGMRLNELGLWKRPDGWKPSEKTDTKDDNDWVLIPTASEEDIFDEIGQGWVEPGKRNFNNLLGRRRSFKE